MWHFIADTHFGHGNIIKYCNRPFMNFVERGMMDMIDKGVIPERELRISDESIQNMANTMFDNINRAVDEKDTLVIVGDFCWLPRDRDAQPNIAKKYRDRINCKNVYLIWGNHDDRRVLSPYFTACYDKYTFNIDGQKVVVDHYPSRSWDKSSEGSWMLYGHVHNLFEHEDNGKLPPYKEKVFSEGFERILASRGIKDPEMVRELIDVTASVNGIDLTCDVGVDHVRENVPFGTPWSMPDLYELMGKKQQRWKERRLVFDKKVRRS